jgi:antitoxin PrlF
MLQSIMTARGQITIPIEIREKLQLNSGNKLEFFLKDNQIIILSINRSIKELKGILPKPNISLTCEEMDEVIKDMG